MLWPPYWPYRALFVTRRIDRQFNNSKPDAEFRISGRKLYGFASHRDFSDCNGRLGHRFDRHRLGAGLSDEAMRSEEHTSELQSPDHLVCRLLLEKKKDEQSDTPTR